MNIKENNNKVIMCNDEKWDMNIKENNNKVIMCNDEKWE
jgi:hypothetical protein